MCLEDLRLGRGRFRGKSVQAGSGGLANSLLPPNGRRVALLISADEASVVGQSFNLYAGDSAIGVPFVGFTVGSDPLLLRLEDIGVTVQESWSADISQLTQGGVTISEILTNQVVTPMPSDV